MFAYFYLSYTDVTPKNHLLNETPCKNESISGLLQSQASSSASQSQSPCEHNSQEYIPEKSPDILALMVSVIYKKINILMSGVYSFVGPWDTLHAYITSLHLM